MEKLAVLKDILSGMESVLVAYSGGVDSTLLVKVSKDVLQDHVVAVTAQSETYPAREVKAAKEFAGIIGIKHIIINTKELENEDFAANSAQRCYYCKSELFTKLNELAREHGLNYVADGSNYDDTKDFRPGAKAACELGVRSPLKEAGFRKQEIRILSKELNLPSWNKPSYPCLSSRFPYGSRITSQELIRVNQAEELLATFGFSQLRLRVHGAVARIEVPQEEIPLLFGPGISEKVMSELKRIGYAYITVDLQGYRMGSMNETLKTKVGMEFE
ncbi:ATP-dependent sacrificial sulfur transferase LarE [Candidatus Omnitrophota bacterium]